MKSETSEIRVVKSEYFITVELWEDEGRLLCESPALQASLPSRELLLKL